MRSRQDERKYYVIQVMSFFGSSGDGLLTEEAAPPLFDPPQDTEGRSKKKEVRRQMPRSQMPEARCKKVEVRRQKVSDRTMSAS